MATIDLMSNDGTELLYTFTGTKFSSTVIISSDGVTIDSSIWTYTGTKSFLGVASEPDYTVAEFPVGTTTTFSEIAASSLYIVEEELTSEISKVTIGSTTYDIKDSTARTTAASKSTVSVSSTGTATDEISYITIDGTEKKIAGGSSGVSSVNGKTGAVTLYGTDINMSTDTSLPTVTEQISSNKTNIGDLATQMATKEALGKITINNTEYTVTRKALTITSGSTTTTYYVADITS